MHSIVLTILESITMVSSEKRGFTEFENVMLTRIISQPWCPEIISFQRTAKWQNSNGGAKGMKLL
jgi:hypothetical protein